MPEVPTEVLSLIAGLAFTGRHPAWLEIDRAGRLVGSGGPLAEYGLPELAPGTRVAGRLALLEGMLPAGTEPLLVPCVAAGSGWTADIHVFRGTATDWVVLLDAREAEHERWLLTQKANELALTHEREARLIEELDAFAHTVAHDLRNPLSAVVGFAELLLLSGACAQGEPRQQLEQILRSGKRMSRIIDELLMLAGVRQGDPPIVAADMGRVVAETLDRLDFFLRESGAELIVPSTWPTALGHAPWIEEIWANYLTNAVKYGGSPPRVELGADPPAEGMVRFWVRDNGQGISATDQARLFTPCTRLDGARAKGHGLGLSIVRRIARKLGGDTFVESTPGKGSRFGFTLRSAVQPTTTPTTG